MINLLKVNLYLISSLFLFSIGTCNSDEKVETEVFPTGDYFLFVSDIHLNAKDTALTTYKHDTKLPLWNNAKTKLASIVSHSNPPKFIIYTGDLPDHHPDRGSDHNYNVKTALDDLKSLSNGLPLFYAPGNNDALGGDYHSFSNSTLQNPFTLLSPNSGYPAPNADTIYSYNSVYGYYSARPFKGLRIIALNTVLLVNKYVDDHCSNHSHRPIICQSEAVDTQFIWLGQQLADAKANNEKAYIIMHVPPGQNAYNGSQMWNEDAWLNTFIDYTYTYKPTISGFLYGHTHMDELRRINYYDSTSMKTMVTEVGISAPGITPVFKNNPGFKTVSYDTNMEMIDFRTYYSIPTAASWGNDSYSFSNTYNSGGKSISDFISTQSTDDIYTNMHKTYYVGRKNQKFRPYVKTAIDISNK